METALLFKEQLTSFEASPFQPLPEREIYNSIQKKIPEDHTIFTDGEFAELVALKCIKQFKEGASQGDYFAPLGLFND